jgi:hypothetical protein
VNTHYKSQTADLHHLESKTMSELFNLIRQHYEKNEAVTSLVSKVNYDPGFTTGMIRRLFAACRLGPISRHGARGDRRAGADCGH